MSNTDLVALQGVSVVWRPLPREPSASLVEAVAALKTKSLVLLLLLLLRQAVAKVGMHAVSA